MERTSNGNTTEQQAILVEDLKNVLFPYTTEQLYLSFLDAKSFLDSINEQKTDPEYAEVLEKASGYHTFISTLNKFITEKNTISKLTTIPYIIDDSLSSALDTLRTSSEDSDIDALEENFLQQRHLFVESRGRIQQEVRDIYSTAAAEIRNIGLDAANLLVEGCNQEEVEESLEQYIVKANDIIDNCQIKAIETLDKRLNEIGHELENLETNTFSQNLKARLIGKFDTLPEGIKNILSNAGLGLQKASNVILNNAYKAGVQGGLKLTNFSGSTIHQMVLKIGHGLSFKFKPWQAIKITKGIAIGGQVFNVLGVGFSVIMQIKADRDDEKLRKILKENRQNIRSQFNTAANDLEQFGRQYIKENVDEPIDASISSIDNNIREIRETRTNRNDACRLFESLQDECRLLIHDIHTCH